MNMSGVTMNLRHGDVIDIKNYIKVVLTGRTRNKSQDECTLSLQFPPLKIAHINLHTVSNNWVNRPHNHNGYLDPVS